MAGDRDGVDDFGLVYLEHLDVVLAFCVRRIGDRELAADLAAEVFAAALMGRHRYRHERGSVRQWLLGIAAKKVVDLQRRGYVERRAQQQLGMAEIHWEEGDLDRVQTACETHLQQLLGELPDDQRTAIEQRVIGERSYTEIASDAGISEQVVRKRVTRGLQTIRHRLRTKEQI